MDIVSGEDDVSRALARLKQAKEAAIGVDSSPSQDVVPVDADAAVQVREQLAWKRAEMVRHQKNIADAQEQLTNALNAQKREIELALGPLQAELDKLTEAVWTVNLYLGRDEQMVQVTTGEPAQADTPVTVRQRVLAMDEESLLHIKDGGMDSSHLNDFVEWLQEDTSRIHSILPEERGVVVLRPRGKDKDYKDPWQAVALQAGDMASWWLIRNGENTYLMNTDIDVGKRLVPAADEFTSMFVDSQGDQLVPGSQEWLQAEQVAAARSRHFMRIGLILQGLADRTTCFTPTDTRINFLQPAGYTDGSINLVADDELAVEDSVVPFKQFQRERNGKLEPGMRIVGSFSKSGDYEHRYSPRNTWETPKMGQIYVVEKNSRGELVIKFDRMKWDMYEGEVQSKKRGSYRLERFDPNFITVDTVTEEELVPYLSRRRDLSDGYLDMVPVIESVIAAKQDEREKEKPLRDLLIQHIHNTYGDDVDTICPHIDDLVAWWKTANKWHRPLIVDGNEKKAINMITKEYELRQTHNNLTPADMQVVDKLRADFPNSIAVAKTRAGKYVAIEPQTRTYPESVAPRNVYTTQHVTTKTMRTITTSEWVTLSSATIAKWHILWNTPEFDTWVLNPDINNFLTDQVMDTVEQQTRAFIASDKGMKMLERELGSRGFYKKPAMVDNTALSSFLGHNLVTTWRAPDPQHWSPLGEINLWFLRDTPKPIDLRKDILCVTGKVTMKKGNVDHITFDMNTRSHISLRESFKGFLKPENELPWETSRNEATTHSHSHHVQELLDTIRLETVKNGEKDFAEKLWQGFVKQLNDAVHAQWQENEYQRFLQDYADPTLWEHHLSTLKQPGEHYFHTIRAWYVKQFLKGKTLKPVHVFLKKNSDMSKGERERLELIPDFVPVVSENTILVSPTPTGESPMLEPARYMSALATLALWDEAVSYGYSVDEIADKTETPSVGESLEWFRHHKNDLPITLNTDGRWEHNVRPPKRG